jgi:hypothetical protein
MAMLGKILKDHPEIWDAVIPHSLTAVEVAEDIKGLKSKRQQYAYIALLETAAKIAENNVAIAKQALVEIEKPDPWPWTPAPS